MPNQKEVQVYKHQFPCPIDSIILQLLKQHMPQAIYLRRQLLGPLQPTAEPVLLATFAPDADAAEVDKGEFAIGYVDRNMRPNNEMYLYSTPELRSRARAEYTLDKQERRFDDALATRQILALVSAAADIPIPAQRKESTSQIPANHIFLGATHEWTASTLRTFSGVPLDHVYNRGGPYHSLTWRAADMPAQKEDFSSLGLEWDTVQDADMPLVMANNSLVRRKSAMMVLPSLGLRRMRAQTARPETQPEGAAELVAKTDEQEAEEHKGEKQVMDAATHLPLEAWVFMGQDGSVRSLHTMPGYRGKGLAKAVTARLVRQQTAQIQRVTGDSADDWHHAAVAPDNVPSIRSFEALGAAADHSRFWIRVDANAVKRVYANLVA